MATESSTESAAEAPGDPSAAGEAIPLPEHDVTAKAAPETTGEAPSNALSESAAAAVDAPSNLAGEAGASGAADTSDSSDSGDSGDSGDGSEASSPA